MNAFYFLRWQTAMQEYQARTPSLKSVQSANGATTKTLTDFVWYINLPSVSHRAPLAKLCLQIIMKSLNLPLTKGRRELVARNALVPIRPYSSILHSRISMFLDVFTANTWWTTLINFRSHLPSSNFAHTTSIIRVMEGTNALDALKKQHSTQPRPFVSRMSIIVRLRQTRQENVRNA